MKHGTTVIVNPIYAFLHGLKNWKYGAIKLVNEAMFKLDELNEKISAIDTEISTQQQASLSNIAPHKSSMGRTTVFAEVLRMILLVLTAFLVHVFLSRVSCLRERERIMLKFWFKGRDALDVQDPMHH